MDDHCLCRSKRKMIRIICCACGKSLYEPDSKRRKRSPEADEASNHFCSSIFTMGAGEIGQLGLGPYEWEKERPTIVNSLPDDVVQIAAGGMHSVCLTGEGVVYTFGLNDDGSLGRTTEEENQCFLPATVGLSIRIVQVSAGDSHTAAITYDGRLFIWGTFKDNEGNPFLIHEGPEKSFDPLEVMQDIFVTKVSSGTDHIVCLTYDEQVYSFAMLLKPEQVTFPRSLLRFNNIWTGNYSSFAKTVTGEIYAWGLNNFYQLGFGDMAQRTLPERWPQMDEDIEWMDIAASEHHTLALDNAGRVHSVGRGDYGQLGIGRLPLNSEQLRRTFVSIPKLQNADCVSVACGTNVSFAVTRNGTVYCWGTGSEQLGLGDLGDRSIYLPTPIGEDLSTRRVLSVAVGGQHTIILSDEPNSKTWCDVEGHVLRV